MNIFGTCTNWYLWFDLSFKLFMIFCEAHEVLDLYLVKMDCLNTKIPDLYIQLASKIPTPNRLGYSIRKCICKCWKWECDFHTCSLGVKYTVVLLILTKYIVKFTYAQMCTFSTHHYEETILYRGVRFQPSTAPSVL